MTRPAVGDRRLSRRGLLCGLGTAGTLALAGCQGDDGPATDATTTDGQTATTTVRQLLDSPVAGDPDASVTLAVFEDFACPHCANYNGEGYPVLRSNYVDPERIRYEHHDFPIPVANPGSWEAANAARAVQDRRDDAAYYEYADRLFANYSEISSGGPDLYAEIAGEMDLDGDAISQAGVNRIYDRTVRRDREEGIEDGVEGTPTFVVNGEIVASGWGGETLATVETALEDRLGTSA